MGSLREALFFVPILLFKLQARKTNAVTRNMTDIQVLIACNSPDISAKIEGRLSKCATIDVVGSASTPEEILRLTRRFLPDVLVVHIASCGRPDTDLLLRLKQVQPQIKTLALECAPEQIRTYFVELAPWGLSGCICEWEKANELIDAVCTIGNGDSYLCPLASHVLVDAYRDMRHHVAQRES